MWNYEKEEVSVTMVEDSLYIMARFEDGYLGPGMIKMRRNIDQTEFFQISDMIVEALVINRVLENDKTGTTIANVVESFFDRNLV